jgi:hypothetical protein
MNITENSNESIFEKEISPFVQLGLILGMVLLFQFLMFGINYVSKSTFELRTFYTIPLALILVYAVFNSVLSIAAVDQNRYWGKSILCYAILCIVGFSMAYFLSGINIDEAGAYRWMISVFSFGYLLFLSLISVMKRIVLLAQKQDKKMRGEE